MKPPKDITALVYQRGGSDKDFERVSFVLDELLKAVYPSDPYPAIVRKKPTADLHDGHIHISAPFNKATKDQLEAALEQLLGRAFDISYTTDVRTLNKKAQIDGVISKLGSIITPTQPVPFGPITPHQAALEQAERDAQRELEWQERQEESARQQAQAEMDNADPYRAYE